MKLQVKRRTANDGAVTPSSPVAGEPVLSRAVDSSNNTYDALYIGSRDGSSYKQVAMAEVTPSYNIDSSSSQTVTFADYSLVFCTQAQYNAMSAHDPATFYFITQ